MTESIIVALITGSLALLGQIYATRKANEKTLYRIDQLEKKQDKYNNLQERMVIVEKDVKHIYYEIDELKGG